MASNNVYVAQLVSSVIDMLDGYTRNLMEKDVLALAKRIQAEMEAEEEALCRHLEEMHDGAAFTADCALESRIGAWA